MATLLSAPPKPVDMMSGHISTCSSVSPSGTGDLFAALFAAACRIAAVVAERPEGEEAALDAYGRNLGIAFQLVDDAIDYVSDAGTMGKDAGDDFREGKMTLPAILAYARGTAEERRFWQEAIAGFRVED